MNCLQQAPENKTNNIYEKLEHSLNQPFLDWMFDAHEKLNFRQFDRMNVFV